MTTVEQNVEKSRFLYRLYTYLVDYGWMGLTGWTEVGWMDDGWTVIGRQTKLMDDWHWEVWITDK